MSSLLVISDKGEGLSLAYRAAMEGVLTRLYVRSGEVQMPDFPRLKLIPNPFSLLEQFDYILGDSPQLGDLSLNCEERNFRMVGCTPLSTKLLEDEVQKKFIGWTYGEQDDVTPTPLHVTTWWAGDTFHECLLTHVFSRLMEGDKGPIVGCSGTVSRAWTPSADLLEPLIPALQKDRYIGPLTLQLNSAQRPIHLTLGPQYDLLHAYFECVHNLDTLLLNTLEGRVTPLRKEYVITVRVLVEGVVDPHKLQIDTQAWKHVHLSGGSYFTVSGRGETISEARRRVYRTFSNLNLHPDMMYRLDIGRGADHLFKEFTDA